MNVLWPYMASMDVWEAVNNLLEEEKFGKELSESQENQETKKK